MSNPYYVKQFDVLPGSTGRSQAIEDEFARIEDGFDLLDVSRFPNVNAPVTMTDEELNTVTSRSLRAGDTYTGTHDFTGATVTAATQAASDNSTKTATTAFVQSAVTAASIQVTATAASVVYAAATFI